MRVVGAIDVAVPFGTARSFAPSEVAVVAGPFTPMNGIVTVKGTPSSGFTVIGPSSGGKSATGDVLGALQKLGKQGKGK